jgi:hypothetical protein
VRHRAKPSFTVEVKRNNKRVPLTVAPAGSLLSERHRQADQLLFGDLSGLAEPAGRPKGGRLSIRHAEAEPQVPAAEAVTSEIDVKAARVRPTGRVLPDLSEQSRAEVRLRQELDEREVRLRAQRNASRPSSGSRPKWAKVQAGVETRAGRKAAPDPIPAAETAGLKQPVLAVNEVGTTATVEPVAASTPRPPHGPQQRTGTPRGHKTGRVSQAVGHGSKRQEASGLLRAGERWKRRLPRVCW